MKGMLSLEQELRATRLAGGQRNSKSPGQPPEPIETERPWRRDIDQLQQTMREVMRAVATFSGVELPGLPPGLQNDTAPLPRLDIKTLKDRFRNDLEGFSIKTMEELTKRAREQTRAALEAVQNEIAGRIEQIAAELREQLQLPAQMEKLLGPSVQEAAARLEKSLSQKFEHKFAEQEQMIQDKLQAAMSSVQGQIRSLEQTVQQFRAKADSIERPTAQPPTAKIEELLAKQEEFVQDKLQVAMSSVQAQIRSLEQAVQQIRTKADSIERPTAQPPTAKIEELLAKQEEFVQDKLQAAMSSLQGQIRSLEQIVHEVRTKADSMAQMPTQPLSAAAVKASNRDEGSFNSGFKDFLERSFSRIESSISNLKDIPRLQPAQSRAPDIEWLRKAIPSGSTDMLLRVQEAMDNLDRLGPKKPLPVTY
ncbi:MAG TPA: hypothetical protein VFC10_01250 [Terriglobia bacterium]|nr:hypothetical protein [Terriglobia bacterium]